MTSNQRTESTNLLRSTPLAAAPVVEEGDALARMHRQGPPAVAAADSCNERFDVVVIGGGQAGLSTGYHLSKTGLRFVILDANARVGDVWRNRWDSLRLFSPASLDGLDGMPFPAPGDYFPTKDEMADYLESYAAHFKLPVRNGVRVTRVSRSGDDYRVETSKGTLTSRHVVVAMASYQRPRVPEFASELDSTIRQLHSSEYRRPTQLKPGTVLMVGAGNSGAEVAVDLMPHHKVLMAGRDTGQPPFRINSWLGRKVLCKVLLRGVFHHVLTVDTPMGRKARPKITGMGGPLIRTRAQELAKAGIERAPRVVGVREGKPVLEDGRTLDVANVIWSTGFHPGFDFVDLPIHGDDGEPRQYRGVVDAEPGLYFVGLHFMYSMSSSMIHGVGRDSQHVVRVIAERQAESPAVQRALAPATA